MNYQIKKLNQFIKAWIVPPALIELLVRIKMGFKPPTLSVEEIELLKQNDKLKDRHVGNRCFVLGAGSSIKEQDITKLEDEFVISVSNTFVHPDFTRIKPRYHILPPLIKAHGRLHSEAKFTDWLTAMEAATSGAEMFMHIGDREMIKRNGLFKDRVVHWVEYSEWNGDFSKPIDLANLPSIWSVSELALTTAVYLGFDKIYLIGVDHDWFNGLFVYFYDHTKDHILRSDINGLDHVDSEFQMRRHAEIFKKYKYLYSLKKNIYNANANPNSYLDAFPKVDFNSLFG